MLDIKTQRLNNYSQLMLDSVSTDKNEYCWRQENRLPVIFASCFHDSLTVVIPSQQIINYRELAT